MDPQSQSFTPYSNSNENWRFHTDLARIQQIQAEHAERLARLERKQDDDARVKSVWNGSPFPSVLSGTPQQAPLNQPPGDQFRTFDDDVAANHLMSSLHLDAEDEPRRGLGAASRANSVRFDETANQNHFSHTSRPSVEILSRTSSGFGGVQMTERTSSYKSDGRASSVHSVRSAASGRANSLNLETAYGLAEAGRVANETPGLAPGLLLLGAAPAIIRCWMNTNFKHDGLLYAAVCTGSYHSFLDLRLIKKLGFEDDIRVDNCGLRMVELSVYFPEAVPHPASSRSSSPAPQLPSLSVDFRVTEHPTAFGDDDKAIQIFLGSDILRAHSADILFSSNSMTLFDDDNYKLSIPLSRPENEAAFNSLYTTSGAAQAMGDTGKTSESNGEPSYGNGISSGASVVSSSAPSPPPGKYRPPGSLAAETGNASEAVLKSFAAGSEGNNTRPVSRQSNTSRTVSSFAGGRSIDAQDLNTTDSPGSMSQTQRSGSIPAIRSSWRRDGPASTTAVSSASSSGNATTSSALDWASASKGRETPYQRKDTGIKVLKPKTAITTRALSISATPGSNTAAATPTTTSSTPQQIPQSMPSPALAATSPNDGSKSRFFDDGRRRTSGSSTLTLDSAAANNSLAPKPPSATVTDPSSATAPKTKSNPIGSGSAFSWLNLGPGSNNGAAAAGSTGATAAGGMGR